jgi:hypothetical protein
MAGNYDWLDSSSDIMDALDSAESRAYAAESALAESAETGMAHPGDVPFSLKRLFGAALGKLEVMAIAGGWAYSAYTVFSKEEKNAQGVMTKMPHMPEAFGIGADVWTGVGFSLAAFFGKLPFIGKIPVEALTHVDRIGTASLAHWAVVGAQRAGAATLGIDVTNKIAGEGEAQVGSEAANENQAGAPVDRSDPADYMTPAQRARWEQFRPRNKKAA